MNSANSHGLCYLHLQTVDEAGDDIGAIVKSLDAKRKQPTKHP